MKGRKKIEELFFFVLFFFFRLNTLTIYMNVSLDASSTTWVNPSNSTDPNEYDHITIYVKTQQGDVTYDNNMANWPMAGGQWQTMQFSVSLGTQGTFFIFYLLFVCVHILFLCIPIFCIYFPCMVTTCPIGWRMAEMRFTVN